MIVFARPFHKWVGGPHGGRLGGGLGTRVFLHGPTSAYCQMDVEANGGGGTFSKRWETFERIVRWLVRSLFFPPHALVTKVGCVFDLRRPMYALLAPCGTGGEHGSPAPFIIFSRVDGPHHALPLPSPAPLAIDRTTVEPMGACWCSTSPTERRSRRCLAGWTRPGRTRPTLTSP